MYVDCIDMETKLLIKITPRTPIFVNFRTVQLYCIIVLYYLRTQTQKFNRILKHYFYVPT